MKILILTNLDVGLYKFRKELLEEFQRNGFEVFVSLPDGEFIDKIKELGCHFIQTDINRRGTNPLQDIRLYSDYCRMIREVKPDVILTYTIKPNVYGGMAAQRHHVPYITNITGLGSALENPGVLQSFTKILYRIGIKKADKVFFQNEANRDFMVDNGLVSDNYDLLPGSGVNLEQYECFPYPKDRTTHFVFVGRMMKEKGFELYLDAAERIHQKYPDTLFHICGIKEENYYARVEKLTEDGACFYHGLVDDMKEIYRNMHCVVHPTYYPEGMSNVLLEAQACGRPVITTDRPGCREIVDDGINGFIVKQKDLDDLVEKIEKFLEMDDKARAAMGRKGREKVETSFDRNIVVGKYMEEIKKYDR